MSSSLMFRRRDFVSRNPGRTFFRWKRSIALALLLTVQSSFAQNAGASAVHSLTSSLAARYPAGSILTMDAADRALAEVVTIRTQVESQFALEEQACFSIFFVSSCRENAQEHRREALARMRLVEIEANTFVRRMHVLDRDNALAEKRAALAAEEPQRAKEQLLKETETARKVLDSAQKIKELQDAADVNASDAGKRVDEHAENLRRMQAAEAASAPKRAANVVAFAQKSKDAEKRQREVSASKLEKERMRIRQARDLPVDAK